MVLSEDHPQTHLTETTPHGSKFANPRPYRIAKKFQSVMFIAQSSLPARIRFVQFGECSLDLDVVAYIDTTDYGEYLEIAEDVNLRIMDVIKNAGTELAIPTQIEYKINQEPLEETQIRKTEDRVQEWRTQQALYIPKFPPEKITELRGTLDYPPEGSAVSKRNPQQSTSGRTLGTEVPPP